MAKSIETIKQSAEQVRNEKQAGANTAARVGGVIADLADNIKDLSMRTDDHEYALNGLSTLNVFDAGICKSFAEAITKAIDNDKLQPFMFITGFYSDEESPFLIIGNIKNFLDDVTWEDNGEEVEGSGIHKYTLQFPCLVFESSRIFSSIYYIYKMGDDGEVLCDDVFTGVNLMNHEEGYGDEWNMSMHDLKYRLAAVERKLKELTASTQA